MNSEKLYYQTPSDELFEEVKQKSISVWETVGNEESYRAKKISHIKEVTNIRDNMMHIVAMFSEDNMIKLSSVLSNEAKISIRDRILSVGSPEYIHFEPERSESEVLNA